MAWNKKLLYYKKKLKHVGEGYCGLRCYISFHVKFNRGLIAWFIYFNFNFFLQAFIFLWFNHVVAKLKINCFKCIEEGQDWINNDQSKKDRKNKWQIPNLIKRFTLVLSFSSETISVSHNFKILMLVWNFIFFIF